MLQGSYIIKREGKPPIEFSNVITRKGWQTFLEREPSIELIKTLKLSRDLGLVSADKEDLNSIFKEVTLDSFSVVLKQEPVWRYESEFRFYLRDLPAGNLGQLGIYSSSGDIFSCANIKNPMGGITHLAIEEGESLEIVYSLTYTLDVKEYKTTFHFGNQFQIGYADRIHTSMEKVIYEPDINEAEEDIHFRFEFSVRFLPYHGEELKNNFNRPMFEAVSDSSIDPVVIPDPIDLGEFNDFTSSDYSPIPVYVPSESLLWIPILNEKPSSLLDVETPFLFKTTKGVFSLERTLVKGTEEEFRTFANTHTYNRWYPENPTSDDIQIHVILNLKNHDNYERQ